MILVIDNYDSFTYNLVQLIGGFGVEVHVERNDAVSLAQISAMTPSGIVLSPGPGRPEQAGICLDLIRATTTTPLLGVCLGHQAIGIAFGGDVVHAPSLLHGKSSQIHHSGKGIFKGLPLPFEAGRYHSLVIGNHRVPQSLRVTAETPDRIIMAVEHTSLPVTGVQFHPESILTPAGNLLLNNWLSQRATRT